MRKLGACHSSRNMAVLIHRCSLLQPSSVIGVGLRSLRRRLCLPSILRQIRLFEFERNWLSPVMTVWFCGTILLENHPLVSGISLAERPRTGSNSMKQSTSSYTDQNWSWPQSTWFQKRLNAIKAQEEAARQKQPAPQKPAAAETKSSKIEPAEDL